MAVPTGRPPTLPVRVQPGAPVQAAPNRPLSTVETLATMSLDPVRDPLGAATRPSDRGRPRVIRLLIADDHPAVRVALVELFDAIDDIHVVGACADGSEVTPMAELTEPDVVLMDLQMPRMSGLEATRELLAAQPSVRVVVLSGHVTPASAQEAKVVGAAGFLLKEEDPGDLPERIRIVAAGGTAWSEAAAELSVAGQA
jgi:CheY-like chemotaxis protein